MSDPNLADLAAAFLTAAVSALGSAAPAVQYVSPAPPAIDCEQLVAWVAPVLPQTATPTGTTLARQYRYQVQVQGAWCWPSDNPSAADLEAAGLRLLGYGSNLLFGISRYIGNNGLPAIFGCSRYVLVRQDSFIAGGMAGWTCSYWLDS